MKYQLTVVVLLALMLSGCANVAQSVQANTPAATALQESTQVNTPAVIAQPESTQENTPSSETFSSKRVSEKSIEVVGGNEESMREFIKQWIAPVYPDGSSQNITVYIGDAPKDMPYDLPVPDDVHVVGSVTGNFFDYLLIFDTSLTSESIHEFYAKSLVEKGWHKAPSDQGQPGFTSQAGLNSGYCYKDDAAFLSVETPMLQKGKTGIRLSLDTSPDVYMCGADTNPGAPYANLIPSLSAPEGMMMQGGGSGGSDTGAEVTATLKGKMSETELAEFYNKQLLSSKWKLQNSGTGEGAAWSNWAFKDDKDANWVGTLIVTKSTPDSDSLFALLRIQKAN
jgi:hypothetical protein